MKTDGLGWRWVRQKKCSRARERLADGVGVGPGQTLTRSAALATWALVAWCVFSVADAAPAKVLLLSGQNNHAWEKTTPVLRGILEDAGACSVEVTDAPQDLDPAGLKGFDVIVSNWNAWGAKGKGAAVADWPEALKKAYVEFVASGGGHVAVHAGTSSFEGWEDYQRICGATWGLGQTSHGPPHEFEVRVDDPSHPITRGLAAFRTTDELWNRPKVQPGFRAIASSFSETDHKGTGEWEPTAIVGTFGRGRCYALLLGHDATAMGNPGFKELLRRGVAWAAAGKAEAAAGKAVPALRDWTPDQGLAPFNEAARAVQAAGNDPAGRAEVAKKLAGLLGEPVPAAVKKFACEQLAVVGGEAEAGALCALLGDEALETPARGALERFGGERVAALLREAYSRAETPARRAGILGSLAKLGDARAVPLAAGALASEDGVLRAAAMVALGQIGGEAAAGALLGIEGSLGDADKMPWGGALLACAEGMGPAQGGRILDRLVKVGRPASIRAAALAAKIRLADQGGLALAVRALRGADEALRRGALDALRADRGARLRAWQGAIARAVGEFAEPVRLAVLDAYVANRIRGGALLAEGLARSKDPAARGAGLRALGELGSEPYFDILFDHLVGESPEDRAAATDGLAVLRAASTDGRLIALLETVEPTAAPAVVEVLRRRGTTSAVPALLTLARGGDAETAKAAARAAGELGGPAAIPGLADVISKGGPGAQSAAQVLAKIARAEPEVAKARLAIAIPMAPESARETFGKILALVDGSAKGGSAAVPGLGRNLAVGAQAESPTGLKADGAAGGPGAAVDGDPATYWDEQNGQPEYRLRVTLKEEATVSRLRITGYRHHEFSARDLAVLCNGREVKRVADATYDNNQLLLQFPETPCKVVELRITAYYGGSPAIRELEIFGDAARKEGAKVPGVPSAGGGLSWEKGDDSVALLSAGKPVWRLTHGAKEPFPYFDPLGLVGGGNLVWKSPPDHIHHYAHWFSWKVINGVNYWEFDKATGRPVGVTRCADVRPETRPDGSARIAMRLAYEPSGGKAVLTEDRILDISAPAADGGYRIDWRMEWTAADEPVVLDRTPPPGEPDGKPHGGYAGLSVRFSKEFTDWTVVDSGGVQAMDGHRKRAAASEFGGKIGGRECGVAILDHPENPNAPTPWFYVINPAVPFGYTNPAFLCDSPKRIEARGKLLLRYRVILHAGRWDPGALRAAVAAYAKEVR